MPFGNIPVIGRWFDVVAPGMGDNQTVNVGGYEIDDEEEPFVSRYGAGFRAIYDLADLERSLFVVSTGQAGHWLSPHYEDQSALWSRGQYIPMITRRERIARGAIGTLTLRPPPAKTARSAARQESE
jgi:penicillin amidase